MSQHCFCCVNLELNMCEHKRVQWVTLVYGVAVQSGVLQLEESHLVVFGRPLLDGLDNENVTYSC